MTNEIVKRVSVLYEDILQRKPDKTGLYYFVSRINKKQITIDDVKKILSESEEAKSLKEYTHYSDKYWNDLEIVVKYKNKLATGNENVSWIGDILTRFKEYLPFDDVLIVGCGNGWLERQLYDLGIGKHFDAFDMSEKYINEAKELKQSRAIDYFLDDINSMSKIEDEKYDAVFNFAVLHHAEEVDNALKKLAKCLKTNGLMFNEEYVGPARNQYSDQHLKHMLEVMSDIPEKFRTKVKFLRPPLENFRVEPSEAIHSDLILPLIPKYFDIVYQRNLNGGIAYQILHNNIQEFKDDSNTESVKWLEYLLKQDVVYTDDGRVPILFWYGVCKPKTELDTSKNN
jgi:2-polyprenyl-3-methyl-5-hydroxy-6-metoxy-1,4-benzoquinol methylase